MFEFSGRQMTVSSHFPNRVPGCLAPDAVSCVENQSRTRDQEMKMLRILLTISLIWVIAGCGGSQPAIPNMAGPWTLTLTPHAAGSSAPAPGASFIVTFTQNSNMLSGTVTSFSNQSQTCLQDISGAGNLTVSGNVERPGTGDVPPLNLSLTIAFIPAGSSTSQSITLAGGITNGTLNINGIYQIPGTTTDCIEGSYTLTKLLPA